MAIDIQALHRNLADEHGIILSDDDPIRVFWVLHDVIMQNYKDQMWEMNQLELNKLEGMQEKSLEQVKKIIAEFQAEMQKEKGTAHKQYLQELEAANRQHLQSLQQERIKRDESLGKWAWWFVGSACMTCLSVAGGIAFVLAG